MTAAPAPDQRQRNGDNPFNSFIPFLVSAFAPLTVKTRQSAIGPEAVKRIGHFECPLPTQLLPLEREWMVRAEWQLLGKRLGLGNDGNWADVDIRTTQFGLSLMSC